MYGDLFIIDIDFSLTFRLQSYDIILEAVSVTYGKCAQKTKNITTKIQRVTNTRVLHPMERFRRTYGKSPIRTEKEGNKRSEKTKDSKEYKDGTFIRLFSWEQLFSWAQM